MIRLAVPPGAALARRVRVPPSKSATNRALVVAAQSERPVRVGPLLDSDDVGAMLACLAAAGARVERSGSEARIRSGEPPRGEVEWDVRDSGTACRFLAALAAATPGLSVRLTGSARLRERPVGPLVEALRSLGARIRYLASEGFPPLAIEGRHLEGGTARVSARESSQFVSALLLCGARFRDGIEVRVEGAMVSRPYVDMTARILRLAGVAVSSGAASWRVPPGQAVAAEAIAIPGDASSAAALACAAAASGSELVLEGIEEDSDQPDARTFRILAAAGASVEPGNGFVALSGRARQPISADLRDFPDSAPALAAVAAGVEGESSLRGLAHLRLKESDRLAAIAEQLGAAGVEARVSEDSLLIRGGPRRPWPVLPTFRDHRMAMSAAILALRAGGWVEDPRSVAKSYPAFFHDLFLG